MESEAGMTLGMSVDNRLPKRNRGDLTCDETRLDSQAYQSLHDIVRFLKSCVPFLQLLN